MQKISRKRNKYTPLQNPTKYTANHTHNNNRKTNLLLIFNLNLTVVKQNWIIIQYGVIFTLCFVCFSLTIWVMTLFWCKRSFNNFINKSNQITQLICYYFFFIFTESVNSIQPLNRFQKYISQKWSKDSRCTKWRSL